MQAESDFALVSSISFLIVFSLIQLLQRVPYHSGNIETEVIQYFESSRLQSFIKSASNSIGLTFGSHGRFMSTLFITESIIMTLFMLLYLISEPEYFSYNTGNQIESVIIMALFIIWMLTPTLGVKEYKNVYEAGVRPLSYGVFVVGTVIHALLLITWLEYIGVRYDSIMEEITALLIMLVLVIVFISKQSLFVIMLDKEIECAKEKKKWKTEVVSHDQEQEGS